MGEVSEIASLLLNLGFATGLVFGGDDICYCTNFFPEIKFWLWAKLEEKSFSELEQV